MSKPQEKPDPRTSETSSSELSAVAPRRELTGQTLGGDFQILRLIGRGGMGEVYLAQQLSLNRPVALKVLRTELSSNPTYLSRFEVEATTVARLNHPNIVQVYTLGRYEDLRFIAMEYVRGTNLRDYLAKKGTIDPPLAFSIMRQTCQALDAAGQIGLIHRDIKPENLLLTRKGQVKVTDFGLCREQGAGALHLTQEGVTLGTPMYMSPEQVQGKPLDHRSDLYSMGVTFYQMLAGMPPFRAETAVAVALKHLQETPVDLRVHRPDLPEELLRLVMKLLEKDPARRYQTAREVDRELSALKAEIASTRAGDRGGVPPAETKPSLELEATADASSADQVNEVGKRTKARAGRRWRPTFGPWTVAACSLLGVLVGAAWGWSDRAPDVLAEPIPSGPAGLWLEPDWQRIPERATARDQLRHAQFEARAADRGAALIAVPGYHPEQTELALTAYTQLARSYLRRQERDRLDGLALSLQSAPAASDRHRQLAVVAVAGRKLLDGERETALDELITLDPEFMDPGAAALALELAERLARNPDTDSQATRAETLRDLLIDALEIEPFENGNRVEPPRRPRAGERRDAPSR